MNSDSWRGFGHDAHERALLEAGKRMSFRAKLQWLEDMHAMLRRLNKDRRWIDTDGVIHEPTPNVVREDP